MDGPANTLNYMIAGYSVIFGVMSVYIISIIVRWVNLRREHNMLNDLEENEQPNRFSF